MKKFSDVSSAEKAWAVYMAKAVMMETCKIMWPNDSDGLFEAATREDKEFKLVENIQAAASALPANTVKSDALLAPIAKTYNASTLQSKFSIGKSKQASLWRQFACMESGSCLQAPNRSMEQYQETDMQQAVHFILSNDKVQCIFGV